MSSIPPSELLAEDQLTLQQFFDTLEFLTTEVSKLAKTGNAPTEDDIAVKELHSYVQLINTYNIPATPEALQGYMNRFGPFIMAHGALLQLPGAAAIIPDYMAIAKSPLVHDASPFQSAETSIDNSPQHQPTTVHDDQQAPPDPHQGDVSKSSL